MPALYLSKTLRFPILATALSVLVLSTVVAQDATDELLKSDDQQFEDLPFVALTILDSKGEPIPEAGVLVSCWFQDPQFRNKYQKNQKTNGDGVAKVKLFPTLERIRIWASAKDHVTLFCGFEPSMLPNLPEKISLQLQKSQSIGGKVVDSDGKPISGVAIEIRRSDGGDKLDTNDFSRLNTWIALGEDAVVTDDEGHWMIDQGVPTGDDLKLRFVVKHPDFLSDEHWTPMKSKNVTLKQLKERTATFTLDRAASISGTVLDDTGKPVQDALVVWGDRPYWDHGSQETKTNKYGEFRIPAQKPEPINVTIVAKGWMPQLRKVDLSEPTQPQTVQLKFQLTKGKKLHLRFVDPEGKPVPNVNVRVQKWRGIESLYNMTHSNVKDSQIPRVSDENGEYVWDWAPDDEVEYQTGNRDFARTTIRTLTADDTIQTIEVKQKFYLAGTVVDAQTNEPIDQFSITPVTCYAGGRGIAQSNSRKEFQSSKFKMEVHAFGSHDGNVKFEIASLNYRVKATEEFTPDALPFDGVIAMDPVPPPTGKVVDETGNPIAGASIFVCTKDNGVMVHDIEGYAQTHNRVFKSDQDGTFQYPAQVSRVAITVTNKDGYAERYLGSDEHPGTIVIKPWATVKGQLFQEGKPVADAYISVDPIRTLGNGNPHLQDGFGTTTDDDGKFSIAKVPPVPCSISSQLSPWDDYPITSNRSVPIRLQPGKTHEVNLGGEGVHVVGQVKLKGDKTDHIEFRYGINTLLKVGSRIELEDHLVDPADYLAGKEREETLKLTDKRGTTDGYETHFVKINPDGTFLINGVAPGDYRLLMKIYEPPSG